MSIIPVRDLGQIGVVKDIEPHELPLNAWSDAQNVRMRENVVEKFQGEEAAYDPPSIAPYTLFPIRSGTSYFWVYAGAAKVYATQGTVHTDITRAAGGDYNADADLRWTGDAKGRVLILNNGIDVPQMWNPADTGTKLVALTGWDSNWSCRCMRVFKSYILAMDVTKSGTRYGTMMKWSDSSAADAVPSSWDETDPTTDAGESNGILAETSDLIIDCLPMRDVNVIYKEGSTYGQQLIGGNEIFRFWRMFTESGLLSRWCMAAFKQKQFAVTQDDVIIHDGQVVESVADGNMRRHIKSLIDASNYEKCHVVPDHQNSEMWFCYPSAGQTWCNKAWVWNWKHNTWQQRNLPGISHAQFGRTDVGLAGTWDEDANTWDSDSTRWDETDFDPTARGILLADFDSTKLWRANKDYEFDGSAYTSYVERKGIALETTEMLKTPQGIYPFVEGTDGETVVVKVGGHEAPDDAPSYDVSANYVIGTDNYVDCSEAQARRYLAVRFEDSSNRKWRLKRYDLDFFYDGQR